MRVEPAAPAAVLQREVLETRLQPAQPEVELLVERPVKPEAEPPVVWPADSG